MVFDTDVLIWVFRGNVKAAGRIEESRERSLSVVTLMELFQGAGSKREIRLIKSFLEDFGFRTLPLTENIGHRAAVYMEQYAMKSGIRVADALIAATAVENNLSLLSGDNRHYKALGDLDFIAFRP
ncbi:MAG: twitching motility protein PilT [Candidatus Aminicenantes bacterium RBG_13_62_12]|nr:MAG: twitching motility protein PilT [Candidatus Aminicenantes bacterium RBG_13_62_12]